MRPPGPSIDGADAMRIRAYGESALLIEVADLPAVMTLTAALRGDPPPGLLDLVPAARTVLIRVDPGTPLDAVRHHLAGLTEPSADLGPAGPPVEIEVVYDGPDLADVAAATGLSPGEVIEAHTGRPWTVAFCGFAPGFAYLSGGDPRLRVARRDEPRPRVPAGSVALAGEYSAVYPSASPGGWQLIGHTSAVLWDLTRDPPGRLEPGRSVRFTSVERTTQPGPDGATGPGGRAPAGPAGAGPPDAGWLEVVAPGPLATIQDGGRPGLAALGVSPSGAADRRSWALANRLVGNVDGAAAIEATLGGLAVRSAERCTVALTGATGPVQVDGRDVGRNAAIRLPAGATLRLGPPARGLRTYLAVRGGFDVAPVLGSRSRDQLGRLGPAPLAAGDRLGIGAASTAMPDVDLAPRAALPADVELRCHPGPRTDQVTAAALDTLTSVPWTASDQLDRVGVRLSGPILRRRNEAPGELPSEGVIRGAVQLPPAGQPLIFLADHPTTGGYPVIAVVVDADTDALAQVRPGQRVRLRRIPGEWA